MSTIATPAVPETGTDSYRDPVVQEFYRSAVRILEEAPDGASAATEITQKFHAAHAMHVRREDALTHDVRHLSGENAAKAQMLAHAGRSASRLMEECTRQAGRVHTHQDVEAQLHDLAAELDESHPHIAARIRSTLHAAADPAPPAVGPTIISLVTESRYRTGWFAQAGETGDVLHPLPLAGWALVATVPDTAEPAVQAAFLMDGTWVTRTELAMRGMSLRRID